MLDRDTADDLCGVRLFRLVVKDEQALAGEPFRHGARSRPHARVVVALADESDGTYDFAVFVTVLNVVCAALAGYRVLRYPFRGEERSVGGLEYDSHIPAMLVVENKTHAHAIDTPLLRVFDFCIL